MTNFSDQLPDLSTLEPGPAIEQRPVQTRPGAVMRIPVSVQVVIGTASLPLSQVAQLSPGTMVTLEERLGSPVRMLVNGREVARGELLVLDEVEGTLGLTITEVAGAMTDG